MTTRGTRRQIYVPDPATWERISRAAGDAGESVSEYVLRAALTRAESGEDELTPEEWRRISKRVERGLK